MFTVDHRQMMLQFPHDSKPLPMERKWKNTASSGVEVAPNCPRCASSNTKFCYYNNYSLSQPRYFCKGCRRYWTKGGSLRNVPVGGGCRKSRRAKSSRGAVPTNYSKNFNGVVSDGSYLSDVNSMIQENGSVNANGSEIDLAAVFAKFLNQESSCDQPDEEPSDQELVSVTNSLSSADNDHAVTECLDLKYQIQESNDLLDGLVPARNQALRFQEDRETIQEMIMERREINEFGLQTFPGDEIVQDDLWNETETSFSNGTWQLLDDQAQPLEFDSFSMENQLHDSTNLIGDNSWSCFDLPGGLEVFSRHY